MSPDTCRPLRFTRPADSSLERYRTHSSLLYSGIGGPTGSDDHLQVCRLEEKAQEYPLLGGL